VRSDTAPEAGLLRGALAGLAALLLALVVVNLLAAPLLTPGSAGPAGGLLLVCLLGPHVEELAKYGAFTAIVRPQRRGWHAYWTLGATFGALEAPLKLARLLGPDAAAWREDGAALAALSAGALASLLLHTALGGLVARAGGGRRGLGLAAAAHVAFNSATTGAVLALGHAAGARGSQIGLGLSAALALALLLAVRRWRGREAAVALPTPGRAPAAAADGS
jgi:hypothetical protein